MPDYASPGPIAKAFRHSRGMKKLITGPFASGKSVACAVNVMELVEEQKPNAAGIRKSRWGIIRNSYVDLKNTTVRTWKDWVHPPTYGQFVNVAPFEHKLRYRLSDGTTVDSDIIFLALDDPSDITKLKSLELTGAYVNEMAEIRKPILDTLGGRVGRYPRQADGGPSWYGIIADSNMPDDDHWMHDIMEMPNSGWEIYRQPGGVMDVADHTQPGVPAKWIENPRAENMKNIVPGYYMNQITPDKSQDWIKVYLAAEYGTLPTEGAFYAELMSQADQEGRIARVPYQRERSVDTWWDLGYSDDTSIVFTQTVRGEIHVIDHYAAFGHDIPHYAEVLKSKPYVYRKHNLPHDAKAQTLQGGGRAIVQQLIDIVGIQNVDVPIGVGLDEQEMIQATRVILPRCWFNRDTTRGLVRSLRRYRRERDEVRNAYKRTALHDDASHDADAMGLFAYCYANDNPEVGKVTAFRNPTWNELIEGQNARYSEARIA